MITRLRPLALLTAAAVLTVSACGGASPAPSAGQPGDLPSTPAASTASTPSTSGAAADTLTLVDFEDAADPGAAAQHEFALNQEVRTDTGMAALIGDNGEAVFQELDAQASAFSQESLQQIVDLIDTGKLPEGATSGALADMVAMVGSGLPSRQNERPGDIDLSVFTETGFTTSALLALGTTAIGLADQTLDGTIPRSDHFDNTSNGVREVVDVNMTWVVKSGGGRFSFEVQLSVTDNISDAASGSFVALYTSTSDGKFDVNACPEEGGLAAGTYTFQTKHEMNDVSGAANARSGGSRAVDAPFNLYDGDDAHLLRIETTLDMAADAHSDAVDWTATQTLPIVMAPSGATTSEGGSGLSAQGTGAERAAGSMFNSSVMAQLLMAQIGKETEAFWRSGKCIELTPSRDTGKVDPSEQVDLSVTAAGKFNKAEIDQPIKATFSGAKSLDPADEPVPYPPTFTFVAGPNDGDKGTINLEQVSNRGIGKKTVEFTVGTPQFGGTIHFHGVSNFLNATTTIDITAQVVMVVDATSGQLTVEPAGGGTYSYDFDTTGGNKNCGSDAQNCPPGPPCTYHGEGNLLDPTHIQQGTTDGLIAPTGALGDDVIHLQVAVPISCGEYDLNYVSLASGAADGLEAKLDGDTTYQIDISGSQDLGRPGYVNNSQAHVEGTLAPLDAPPTPSEP